MKKFLILACAAATLSMTTGNADAENIKGKVGVTGKIGFMVPGDGDIGPFNNKTDVGIIGGGGLIYGINKNIAAEIDITRSAFDSDFGQFGITNVSLGGQYRFILDNQQKLTPYVGAGLDLLMNDADQGRDVDTTVGVHASVGADYFIMKQLALTSEAKFIVAPDADINGPTGKAGNFNPNNVSMTFGVRYFFN